MAADAVGSFDTIEEKDVSTLPNPENGHYRFGFNFPRMAIPYYSRLRNRSSTSGALETKYRPDNHSSRIATGDRTSFCS